MNLISQGAEAKIYETNYLYQDCILKQRLRKQYRHSDLDSKLNLERIKAEVKNLDKARKQGVNTPYILYSDFKNLEIYMQKIQNSMKVKDYIYQQKNKEEILKLMLIIGKDLSKLHQIGLIHGDLTTSNILLSFNTEEQRQQLAYSHVVFIFIQYFIDFGLSYIRNNIEDKAVDLYVLERAFLSTHPQAQEEFNKLLEEYEQNENSKVILKLNDVRRRGRKKVCFG